MRVFRQISFFLRQEPLLFIVLFLQALLNVGKGLYLAALPLLVLSYTQSSLSVLSYVLVLIGVRAGIELGLKILGELSVVLIQRLNDRTQIELVSKTLRLAYASLEQPDLLKLKDHSIFAVQNYRAVLSLFTSWVDLSSNLLTLLTISGLVFSFSPSLILIMLFLAAGAIGVSRWQMKALNRSMESNIQVNQIFQYFVSRFFAPDIQKEARLLGLHKVILRRMSQASQDLATWMNQLGHLEGKGLSLLSLMSGVIVFLSLWTASIRFRTFSSDPQIALGYFTFYVAICLQFSNQLFRGIETVSNMEHLFFVIQPLFQYMNLPEQREMSGTARPEPLGTLRFEGVSFSYLEDGSEILHDISFTLRKGEHLSIVGLNGAGKTTLIKLICRLFQPTRGTIYWNGQPIESYDYDAYLREIATVFQDYQMIPLSLRQNLDALEEKSDEDIFDALDVCDLGSKVRENPGDLQAWMDASMGSPSITFSGGEKQKLAFSRALLKEGSLMILDEPTAALDPLAEREIYEQFAKSLKNQAAIFISHRMSTSRFCDRILLIENGVVAGMGSHEEMMQESPLYRELYESQAQFYR